MGSGSRAKTSQQRRGEEEVNDTRIYVETQAFLTVLAGLKCTLYDTDTQSRQVVLKKEKRKRLCSIKTSKMLLRATA